MKSFTEFLTEFRLLSLENPDAMKDYPFEDNEVTKEEIVQKLENHIFPELALHGYILNKTPEHLNGYDYEIGNKDVQVYLIEVEHEQEPHSMQRKSNPTIKRVLQPLNIDKKSIYLLINPQSEKYEYVREYLMPMIKKMNESKINFKTFMHEADQPIAPEAPPKGSETPPGNALPPPPPPAEPEKKFSQGDISNMVKEAVQKWENEFKADKFGTKDFATLKKIFVQYVLKEMQVLDSTKIESLSQSFIKKLENTETNFWGKFPEGVSQNEKLIDLLTQETVNNWTNNTESKKKEQ